MHESSSRSDSTRDGASEACMVVQRHVWWCRDMYGGAEACMVVQGHVWWCRGMYASAPPIFFNFNLSSKQKTHKLVKILTYQTFSDTLCSTTKHPHVWYTRPLITYKSTGSGSRHLCFERKKSCLHPEFV